MNKDIQAQWVENLESGEYPKSAGTLRTAQGFCCLGVLTDMYIRTTGDLQWVEDGQHFGVDYSEPGRSRLDKDEDFWGNEEDTLIPRAVREWAGIADEDEAIHSIGLTNSLARLNDQSDTFDPVIERIKEL